MPTTVWQESTRQELLARAARVTPESARKWGRMTAPQMLAHVVDALKMTLGEVRIAPRRGPLRFPPLRHAIIHWLPFPRGAPTAPELISRSPTDCAEEVETLHRLLEAFASRRRDGDWPEHPAFGRLTGDDWGVLVYRHTDHHFRQFGV